MTKKSMIYRMEPHNSIFLQQVTSNHNNDWWTSKNALWHHSSFFFTTRIFIYIPTSSLILRPWSNSRQNSPFSHLRYRNISVCFDLICQWKPSCHWRVFEDYITHISICCYITNQLKRELSCTDWCCKIKVKWRGGLSYRHQIVPNRNSILLFKD